MDLGVSNNLAALQSGIPIPHLSLSLSLQHDRLCPAHLDCTICIYLFSGLLSEMKNHQRDNDACIENQFRLCVDNFRGLSLFYINSIPYFFSDVMLHDVTRSTYFKGSY